MHMSSAIHAILNLKPTLIRVEVNKVYSNTGKLEEVSMQAAFPSYNGYGETLFFGSTWGELIDNIYNSVTSAKVVKPHQKVVVNDQPL